MRIWMNVVYLVFKSKGFSNLIILYDVKIKNDDTVDNLQEGGVLHIVTLWVQKVLNETA